MVAAADTDKSPRFGVGEDSEKTAVEITAGVKTRDDGSFAFWQGVEGLAAMKSVDLNQASTQENKAASPSLTPLPLLFSSSLFFPLLPSLFSLTLTPPSPYGPGCSPQASSRFSSPALL